MKMPRRPPDIKDTQLKLLSSPEKFELIQQEGDKAEKEGKYCHWDILRRLTPPKGLTVEEWWVGIKIKRLLGMKNIPLLDSKGNKFFSYTLPDKVLQQLHTFDLGMSKFAGVPEELNNPHTQNQYLVSSLIQEAITSSQIEGAATTRQVAKEMLTSGRAPRDKSEQMILNNFRTMQQIKTWKDRPLDQELLFEIHRTVTEDAAGRFRKEKESVTVIDSSSGDILHEPPAAKALPKRLKEMCDFANGKTPSHFIHPLIRAIILHFWLAYDHPFIDGNGRTARVLFYWLMLRSGYLIFEYISISEIILKAPAQYGESFLYTETDQNDLTYFIMHQTEVIRKSLESLNHYIQHKTSELSKIDAFLQKNGEFNSRQEAILAHAFHHPETNYRIEAHKNSHGIAYDTARQDLQDLHEKGFFKMNKKGKAFIFKATPKLIKLLKKEVL